MTVGLNALSDDSYFLVCMGAKYHGGPNLLNGYYMLGDLKIILGLETDQLIIDDNHMASITAGMLKGELGKIIINLRLHELANAINCVICIRKDINRGKTLIPKLKKYLEYAKILFHAELLWCKAIWGKPSFRI